MVEARLVVHRGQVRGQSPLVLNAATGGAGVPMSQKCCDALAVG